MASASGCCASPRPRGGHGRGRVTLWCCCLGCAAQTRPRDGAVARRKTRRASVSAAQTTSRTGDGSAAAAGRMIDRCRRHLIRLALRATTTPGRARTCWDEGGVVVAPAEDARGAREEQRVDGHLTTPVACLARVCARRSRRREGEGERKGKRERGGRGRERETRPLLSPSSPNPTLPQRTDPKSLDPSNPCKR